MGVKETQKKAVKRSRSQDQLDFNSRLKSKAGQNRECNAKEDRLGGTWTRTPSIGRGGCLNQISRVTRANQWDAVEKKKQRKQKKESHQTTIQKKTSGIVQVTPSPLPGREVKNLKKGCELKKKKGLLILQGSGVPGKKVGFGKNLPVGKKGYGTNEKYGQDSF